MKERPILFSAPMVRAILDGKKTQTRRALKPQPPTYSEHFRQWHGRPCMWLDQDGSDFSVRCPYGQPGDLLWVRETWRCSSSGRHYPTQKTHIHVSWREQEQSRRHERGQQHRYSFIVDDARSDSLLHQAYGSKACGWRPSIHMPRWASRITLEVTGVRVERLQAITEDDARAEGVGPFPRDAEGDCWTDGTHRTAFEYLWGQINGFASWAANPWVWVVEFRMAQP